MCLIGIAYDRPTQIMHYRKGEFNRKTANKSHMTPENVNRIQAN